jgi:hypothetical protein
MVIEKPCVARCKSEREQGRMWLRLNREQTADLKAGPFEDPYLAREISRAIIEGRHYSDQTMVFFVPPDVGRAILRWSEKKGVYDRAHRRGAQIMSERYFPQQRQSPAVDFADERETAQASRMLHLISTTESERDN